VFRVPCSAFEEFEKFEGFEELKPAQQFPLFPGLKPCVTIISHPVPRVKTLRYNIGHASGIS